jgi:hypothetical protein
MPGWDAPDLPIGTGFSLAGSVLKRQSARVRCGPTRVSFIGVLAICGLAVSGCTDDVESSATTAISTTGPLVGLRDGEVRDVPVRVFCGADYLPVSVNDKTWRAEELVTDDPYWVPPEWASVAETIDDTSDMLVVKIRMESGESRLIASANGRAVSYRPAEPGDPDNICA